MNIWSAFKIVIHADHNCDLGQGRKHVPVEFVKIVRASYKISHHTVQEPCNDAWCKVFASQTLTYAVFVRFVQCAGALKEMEMEVAVKEVCDRR